MCKSYRTFSHEHLFLQSGNGIEVWDVPYLIEIGNNGRKIDSSDFEDLRENIDN